MPVPVRFEADMSRVRRAIDELVADSSRRTVTVNVAAAAAGGSTGVRAGSGTPVASAVLAQSAAMTAGSATPILTPAAASGVFGLSSAQFASAPIFGGVNAPPGWPRNAYAWAAPAPAPAVASAPLPAGTPGTRGAAGAAAAANAALIAGVQQSANAIYAGYQQGFLPGGPIAPVVPAAGRRAGGRSGVIGGRLFGIGGIIGIGGSVGVVSSAVYADREYAVEAGLAGGDQRAQLDAQMQLRDRIAGSGGFIGRWVAAAQDWSGSREVGIRTTVRAAEAQDRARAGRASYVETTTRMEDAARVARLSSPHAREMEAIKVAQRADTRELEADRRERSEADRARITDEVTAAIPVDGDEVTAFLRRTTPGRARTPWSGPYTTAQREAAAAQLRRDEVSRRMEDAAGTADREIFGPRQRIIDSNAREGARVATRDEMIRLAEQGAALDNQRRAAGFQVQIARAVAANAPERDIAAIATAARVAESDYEANAAAAAAVRRGESIGTVANIIRAAGARTSAIRAQGEATQAAFDRERRYEIEDREGRTRVLEAMIARSPLAARIEESINREDRELRRPEVQADIDLALAIQKEGRREREEMQQEDADQKRYRRDALRSEGDARNLEAEGRFGAAASGAAADSARLEARRLREKENDKESAQYVIENAILEQRAMQQRILQSFDGASVSPNRTAFNGPRGGEDYGQLLSSIDRNIQKLVNERVANGAGTAVTSE